MSKLSKVETVEFKSFKLRSNSHCINLPPEYWKKAGWKIDDDLFIENITLCSDTLVGEPECQEITIKRVVDITEEDCEIFNIDPSFIEKNYIAKERRTFEEYAWTKQGIINNRFLEDSNGIVSKRTNKILSENKIFTLKDWARKRLKRKSDGGYDIVRFKGLGNKSLEEIYYFIHILLERSKIENNI